MNINILMGYFSSFTHFGLFRAILAQFWPKFRPKLYSKRGGNWYTPLTLADDCFRTQKDMDMQFFAFESQYNLL